MFGRLPDKDNSSSKSAKCLEVSETNRTVATNWQNVWEVSETKRIVAAKVQNVWDAT